ncbi:MAG: hypothetical protein GY716_16030 [bacterium]|nr:hypothetical protein [bacterium]
MTTILSNESSIALLVKVTIAVATVAAFCCWAGSKFASAIDNGQVGMVLN